MCWCLVPCCKAQGQPCVLCARTCFISILGYIFNGVVVEEDRCFRLSKICIWCLETTIVEVVSGETTWRHFCEIVPNKIVCKIISQKCLIVFSPLTISTIAVSKHHIHILYSLCWSLIYPLEDYAYYYTFCCFLQGYKFRFKFFNRWPRQFCYSWIWWFCGGTSLCFFIYL